MLNISNYFTEDEKGQISYSDLFFRIVNSIYKTV